MADPTTGSLWFPLGCQEAEGPLVRMPVPDLGCLRVSSQLSPSLPSSMKKKDFFYWVGRVAERLLFQGEENVMEARLGH